MRRHFIVLIALSLTCWSACKQGTPAHPVPRSGPWRMVLTLNDTVAHIARTLPFLFDLERDSAGWHMHIHNGTEHIAVDEIQLHGDSIRIRMPLFDSEFVGTVQTDSTFSGDWHNYLKGPHYRLPFTATAGAAQRFAATPVADRLPAGNWEVHFGGPEPKARAYDAIGIFRDEAGHVTGTFATETGDYRFLDGVMTSDSLFLSSFNGTQAFLFTAALRNDSLFGEYWSGMHHEPWWGLPNDGFALRNEDSLTFLREGHAMVDFQFPGLDGGQLSPKAPEHQGHVVIVQILGSWCPNCADETVMLNELYAKHHAEGLDIIGVAFERYPERERALATLGRFRNKLQVKYPLAYAGVADEHACEKLPFLTNLMSYPTCIFIGRDGMVRRIHTGFYGPGTGEERYAAYQRSIDRFVTSLLAEPAALVEQRP